MFYLKHKICPKLERKDKKIKDCPIETEELVPGVGPFVISSRQYPIKILILSHVLQIESFRVASLLLKMC